MNEGYYSPPFYNDLYNFKDGAQDDIFVDSYVNVPPPSPDSDAVPSPVSYPSVAASVTASATTNSSGSFTAASAQPTSATNSTPSPSSSPGKAKLWYVLSLDVKSMIQDESDRDLSTANYNSKEVSSRVT